MCESQGEQISLPLTWSAEDSHARTCPAQARARALLEAARACGLSSNESSGRWRLGGLSLKTSLRGRSGGWIQSWPGWNSSVIKRFRSLCRRRMLGLGTAETGSLSLLGTLTASDKIRSEQHRAGRTPTPREAAMLPTLRANRWGVPDSHGSRAAWGMLPTLIGRDATKGAWRPASHKPGRPLSEQVGGVLNPTWCEWFLGFPIGWTEE